MIPIYKQKAKSYFTNVRRDIESLLPAYSEMVLEIGCGDGATLSYYKSNQRFGFTTGLELVEEVTIGASHTLDAWLIGPVETEILKLEPNSLDLVLCLDVLEHLVDPWSVMGEIEKVLKPGSYIIASIPNMRTAKVLFELVLRGKFEYEDQGIMDRTHLRWFTRKSALRLLQSEKLNIIRVMPSPLAKGSKSFWVNKCTFGIFREFFTEQYLVLAQKSS
jgi:2-polyprenyl-3-methyl-5-hydroxy-6-metoxy-1,4-benzoquinol methylase